MRLRWVSALFIALLSVSAGPSVAPAAAGIDPFGSGLARVPVSPPLVSPNVDLLNVVPLPGIIGLVIQGNYAYATGASGLHIYDITNPAVPVPAGVLALPHFENEDVSIAGNTVVIAADQYVGLPTLVYVIDVTNKSLPTLKSQTLVSFGTAHTGTCVAPDCRYAFLAGGRGVDVFDTTLGRVVRSQVGADVGGSHDVNIDADGIAWIAAGAGTAGYDITDPTNPRLIAKTNEQGNLSPWNDFIHHNSMRPIDPATGRPGDKLLITEEDYVQPTCADDGSFQTWQITGLMTVESPAVLSPIDRWDTDARSLSASQKGIAATTCSAHWFNESDDIVAIGWYEQGVRFLDTSNPADIKEVGYFVPAATEMWAAYFVPGHPGYVFAVDSAHGIDVLRFDRNAPTASVTAAQSSRIGPPLSKPSAEYGWSCRIAV